MALQPLSIGDILILSQTAWKIGRAFTQGKKGAPAEFAEVEREANGLSEALKLVAETVHTDGSLLTQADSETRAGVNTILESARVTLNNLESFVERYQVIKRTPTNAGFVVERAWSDVVMANYKTFKWTTEGGNIADLRNMLLMHTNTINLTLQALQSRSLARLERTVMPMAETIGDIHSRVHGEIGPQIDDMHHIMMAIANSTPYLQPYERGPPDANSSRNSGSTVSTIDQDGRAARALEAPPVRSPSLDDFLPKRLARRESENSTHCVQAAASPAWHARTPGADSAYGSAGSVSSDREPRHMGWGSENGSPPENGHGPLHDANGGPSRPSSSSSHGFGSPASRRDSNIPRRESTTLPGLFPRIDETEHEAEAEAEAEDRFGSSPEEDYLVGRSPRAPRSSRAGSARLPSVPPSPLPPPAMPPQTPDAYPSPTTPSSFFNSPRRSRSSTNGQSEAPRRTRSIRRSNGGASAPASIKGIETPAFEKALFRNSAILCDVRARLVEYAVHIPDEPDPRYNTEMKEACTECHVCIIRRLENREHGGTKFVTSIWVLSEDGEVRMQQKLSEVNETVPYRSYFDATKVSLPPTEGEISLRFYPEQWADPLKDEKKTNWINYVFSTETDATSFQSALFDRLLIGSYRTVKSTVIHEGLRGAFSLEEQFANIEMLRLWECDGISMPGAAGGVLALMHISSNFGDGWARWWINCSKQQVRIKEDGPKHVKIKGIDILVVKPRSSSVVGDTLEDLATNPRQTGGKRSYLKKVTGIRVEFKTEEEKAKFVSTCRRSQERLLALPDL